MEWSTTSLVPLTVAFVATASGAVFDWKRGIVPNWITFGSLFLGVLWTVWQWSPGALVQGICGGLAAMLVPWILFHFKGMGGGDVKLFLALGVLLGPTMALEIQFASFCLGGMVGIGIWLKQGGLWRRVTSLFRPLTANSSMSATHIRFAPCIFIAFVGLFVARGILRQ